MIRINLLPIKQLEAEVTRRREIIIGSIVLVAALMGMLATHLYQSFKSTALQKESAALSEEIKVLNARVKEVSDLQVKIKDLRGKQRIIEDLNKKKSGPVLVMASLSVATPANLWLTELRESGGNVTMNGLAADNENIASFMKSLTVSKHFSDVELIESTQGVGPTAALKKFAIRARAIYRAPTPPPADAKTEAVAPVKKEEKKS